MKHKTRNLEVNQMRYEMTGKERKRLKKIANRIVIQSECHTDNIVEYFKVMVEAARAEFREDNDTTLDYFLLEQFQNASKQVLVNVIVESEVGDETQDKR